MGTAREIWNAKDPSKDTGCKPLISDGRRKAYASESSWVLGLLPGGPRLFFNQLQSLPGPAPSASMRPQAEASKTHRDQKGVHHPVTRHRNPNWQVF